MSFERTKASASNNSTEEVEADFNEEEDTSTGTGQSEENEAEQEEDTSTNEDEGNTDESDDSTEETVTLSKAEHAKLLRERDNYKQATLSAKGKKRSIESTEETHVDVNEKAVMAVLEKQNERKALRDVIDEKSSHYIPELVDDSQYNEIIGYLPRNIDKSSTENITKALRIATRLWKEERGIVTKQVKKQTDLHTTKSSSSRSGNTEVKKSSGLKILKTGSGPSSWY